MDTAELFSAAKPRAGSLSRPGKADQEQAISASILLVLAGTQPTRQQLERRREKRHPYPYPVYLTPVGRDGVTPVGETIVVLGKHLSEHGFDFYHREPLPHRRAIVSFEARPGKWIGVLLDLSWCRFGRHGWYDNGGRFLSVAPSPLGDELLPSLLE
jgi:hypothetical protein